MRTKRIFTIFTVFVLLAVLATTVYAAPSFNPSTPNLVGTWKITIPKSEGNPETFYSFHTYFADGNFVEAPAIWPALSTASHGVWIGAGNTYLVTFGAFEFDEEGKYKDTANVRASIKMDGADHLTAEWVVDITDVEGKVTEKAAFGTFEGTRMEVVLPEIP